MDGLSPGENQNHGGVESFFDQNQELISMIGPQQPGMETGGVSQGHNTYVSMSYGSKDGNIVKIAHPDQVMKDSQLNSILNGFN